VPDHGEQVDVEGLDVEWDLAGGLGGVGVEQRAYLDSYAHLTAIQKGDLAFAHRHLSTAPEDTGAGPGAAGGPELPFNATLTEPGN
jgi:hypothetical protein